MQHKFSLEKTCHLLKQAETNSVTDWQQRSDPYLSAGLCMKHKSYSIYSKVELIYLNMDNKPAKI